MLPEWTSDLKKPFLAGLIAGLLASAYSLSMPDRFCSEALLLPVDQRTPGMGSTLAVAAAALGVGAGGVEGPDSNFPDILNSRWLSEQLLQSEYRFRVRTWRFGKERWVRGTLYDYLKVRNPDRGVAAVAKLMTVSRDLKTRVLKISVETDSAELSQQLVRDATGQLETFLRQKSQTRGGAKAVFADLRLKEAREEYGRDEDQLAHFILVNRNYQSSPDPVVRLKGLRLEAELRLKSQVIATLSINKEQALMEEKNDLPMLNVLDPGSVPFEKSRPSRAKIALATAFFGALSVWAWMHRKMLFDYFIAK